MLRAIVLAPSASLRERLRTLAQGPGLEIAGETGDARRAHALATHADVLIVAATSLLAQVATHLDPDADADGDDLDHPEVPAYAIVAIANDRRVTATLESLPIRGWAVLPEDPMTDGGSRDVLAAAIAAADAGLGAMPIEWTQRTRDRAIDWSLEAGADAHLNGPAHGVLGLPYDGLSTR